MDCKRTLATVEVNVDSDLTGGLGAIEYRALDSLRRLIAQQPFANQAVKIGVVM